jgi:hypothetical protein
MIFYTSHAEVIDVAQEAEVVERELKELPEGYIVYILRTRRKGLGTLSIQTAPGNAVPLPLVRAKRSD